MAYFFSLTGEKHPEELPSSPDSSYEGLFHGLTIPLPQLALADMLPNQSVMYLYIEEE